MKIAIVIPGRFKSKECEALVANYCKLAGKYASVELVELPLGKGASAKDQDEALGKWLEKRGPRLFLTLLDERGKTFTSRDFASRIEKIKDGSHAEWAIAVGGAHGYGDELKKRAQFLWSLSPATMPHELAATVAAEQVFRGLSILAGHPYHNE